MYRCLSLLLALILALSMFPAFAAGAVASTPLDDADAPRGANVLLAAHAVNQFTLASGETFSFNAVVGPRTEQRGYVPALNGRGAEVVGGGVGQVASAVWLAIRGLPGVSIVEKSTYGQRYNQSYVDSSADAILIDYNAGVDFAFRYTGSGSLTLYTWVEDATLYCEVYLSQ